jgi:hypothetical protein
MRYPGAEWKPISINFQRGGNSPRFLVEHIMQGTLTGTDGWFRNPAAQVSAHFGIGKAGEVIQWVDTADTAWHAVAANHMSIGVEHEGDSGQVLTAAQLEADAKLLAWAAEHHPIPLALAASPAGSGLAYHALGGTDWGGHLACPGAPIVSQLGGILAHARQIREGSTTVAVTADGTKSLQGIADGRKTSPAYILHLTARAAPTWPEPVHNWLQDVFSGKTAASAPVPKGCVFQVPAAS